MADDGFNDSAGDEQRIIQGSIVRCMDGHWTDSDGVAFPPETKLLALATAMALQHWKDKLPIETILKTPGQPLPDLDKLNAKIPKKQWEPGLDKKPRPPWGRQHIVYLLNPHDAGRSLPSSTARSAQRSPSTVFTTRCSGCGSCAASTWSAGETRLQADENQTRPEAAARIHHPGVAATWWRLQAIAHRTAGQQHPDDCAGLQPVEPVTIEEEMDDAIPHRYE